MLQAALVALSQTGKPLIKKVFFFQCFIVFILLMSTILNQSLYQEFFFNATLCSYFWCPPIWLKNGGHQQYEGNLGLKEKAKWWAPAIWSQWSIDKRQNGGHQEYKDDVVLKGIKMGESYIYIYIYEDNVA